MNWSVFKHFHGVGTPPTYDVISTRSLSTVAKGLSSENHALLIAAAPDLLECVKDILDADGDLYAMDFDRYRAALNKATGVRA
jgi:hypothetical protein